MSALTIPDLIALPTLAGWASLSALGALRRVRRALHRRPPRLRLVRGNGRVQPSSRTRRTDARSRARGATSRTPITMAEPISDPRLLPQAPPPVRLVSSR